MLHFRYPLVVPNMPVEQLIAGLLGALVGLFIAWCLLPSKPTEKEVDEYIQRE